MSLVNRLERLFGRFAITNLSLWLVAAQFAMIGFFLLLQFDLSKILLVPAYVLAGEVWRVVTFLFFPPLAQSLVGWIFVAFALYVFYMMGSALEGYWGAFRYNLFILAGWALTVLFAFLVPGQVATNAFLAGSVFLAFAFLNPDFEFYLFFILPVKVKWLAWITWALYALEFATGGWGERMSVLAATGNFFLFFGRDVWQLARGGRRRMAHQARQSSARDDAPEPRHTCKVCGKTDLTHPQLDFRYCSKCAGDECYCPEHIFNHVHVAAEVEKK